MFFEQVNFHRASARRWPYTAILILALCLGPALANAARPKATDIQAGVYRPVYLSNKFLSNSQLRDRLASFRAGDPQKLAKQILSRSYGDALDYFYLAQVSKLYSWNSATRTYARLAAIAFATQTGQSTEGLYRMTEFPDGCGRIAIEHCPITSLGRSIIELNADLDTADALEARAVPVNVPASFPSSAVVLDTNGKSLLHWYPDGRKVWVSTREISDVRFMTLDVGLDSQQVAVPRFDRTALIRVKTQDSMWSVAVESVEAVPRIFTYQGAAALAIERLEKIRRPSISSAQKESFTSTLDLYGEQQRNLSTLRSQIEIWQSSITADNDSKTQLLRMIDEKLSELSRDRRLALNKVGEVERSLEDILKIDSYLRSSGENSRLLQLKCVGADISCDGIRQVLNLGPEEEIDRPYTLFIAPGRERKSQSISGQEIVRSSYVIGTQQVRNPVYQNLQVEYQNAMLAVEAARAEKVRADYNAAVNPGFLSGYLQGAALGTLLRAQGRVEEISNSLSRTPPLVLEEQLSPYEYSESRIKALYRREYGLLLVHKATNRSSTATIVVEEDAFFTTADGRSDSDKSGRTYSSGSDVLSWLARPRSVHKTLFDNASWHSTSVVPNGGKRDYVGAVRKLVAVTDRPSQNPTPGIIGAKVDTASDSRLQSVVLVRTDSSVGSGFFIGKRNILTNAHVVGAETAVEIKFSDGRKGVGRVIAVDETRDLALLRADVDGRPSVFISDSAQIRPGAAVDVIGHPQGLEFSFSRGVVSAIRRDFKPAGGIDVIQTDSAINPGNSGGPLFIGNSVIGIVTFKRGLSEGLGFAVHRDEIQAFLREAFTQ